MIFRGNHTSSLSNISSSSFETKGRDSIHLASGGERARREPLGTPPCHHPSSVKSTVASMTYAMPTSKKRCWTLLVKDIKNSNVKEAEVLSSFRKRYTSARNLAFRSPTNYGDDTFLATNDNDNDSKGNTLPSDIEEGAVLIEIQFTGPQPIEGPAGLLCTLLQSTLVAAYPIQLGRGRKRKVRAGIAAGGSFSFASAPVSGSGKTCAATGAGTVSIGSGHRSSRGFASSSNFDFQRHRSMGSSAGNDKSGGGSSTRPPRPKGAAGYSSACTSDTASEASTSCVFSSTSSTASSSISNLDDLFKDLLDGGGGGNGPQPAAMSTVSRARLPRQHIRRQLSTSAAAVQNNTDAGLNLCPSDPGLAAGKRYHGRREDAMSQAVSLFAAGSAATNNAAGAVSTASEDRLWNMLLDDHDTGLPGPSGLGRHVRHSSSSWGLHPVHGPTKLEDNDDDSGGGDAIGSAIREPRAFSAATPAMKQHQYQQHQQQQQQQQQQRWQGPPWHGAWYEGERCKAGDAVGGFRLPTAGHQISFGWREEECDFDGRSSTSSPGGAEAPSPTSSSPHGTSVPVGSLCHFTFQGLQSAVQGLELRDLVVRAQFFIDAPGANVVEKMASPLEVDVSGHEHATVTYPSILDIWPEMYSMDSIRVIEVAMIVEVRSRGGNFVYTGPTLKVIYRRPVRRMFAPTIPMARQAPHVSCGP